MYYIHNISSVVKNQNRKLDIESIFINHHYVQLSACIFGITQTNVNGAYYI